MLIITKKLQAQAKKRFFRLGKLIDLAHKDAENSSLHFGPAKKQKTDKKGGEEK